MDLVGVRRWENVKSKTVYGVFCWGVSASIWIFAAMLPYGWVGMHETRAGGSVTVVESGGLSLIEE